MMGLPFYYVSSIKEGNRMERIRLDVAKSMTLMMVVNCICWIADRET